MISEKIETVLSFTSRVANHQEENNMSQNKMSQNKMSMEMTNDLKAQVKIMKEYKSVKAEALKQKMKMTNDLKAQVKIMKEYKSVKAEALKQKKKIGKNVIKASKPFYKEMRLKKKEMKAYNKVVNQINKKAKAKIEKAIRDQQREKAKKERASPEYKIKVMIDKFVLNLMNTSTKDELLQYRGFGDKTVNCIIAKRSAGKFANLNETGLSKKQQKQIMESVVISKLLF